MRTFVATLALCFTSSLALASPITYAITQTADSVNRTYTATGYITTDGTIGVLSEGDILDFSIVFSNVTASPLPSDTEVVSKANGGDLYLLGDALSATASNLNFDFSPDSFGLLDIYDSEGQYGMGVDELCLGTGLCNDGRSNEVITINDREVIKSRTPVLKVIGTAAMATTPEPSTFFLLGSGLLGTVGVLRRRRA